MQRTLPATRFASTKREAAAWLGVSVVTLDAWVGKGCPTLPGRGPRKEIGFDLLEVCRWRYGAPEPEGGRLDPGQEKARLDKLRADQIADAIAVKRGELIPVAEYADAYTAGLKPVAIGLESMPDILERDCGLTGAQVEKMQTIIDGMREQIYQDILKACDRMPQPPE